MDPHDHGSLRPGGQRRGVHVQSEAVLADRARRHEGRVGLRTGRPELRGVAYTGPFRGLLRGAPPQVPGRRRRVRDPEELVAAGDRDTADGPAFGLRVRGAGGGGGGVTVDGAGRGDHEHGQSRAQKREGCAQSLSRMHGLGSFRFWGSMSPWHRRPDVEPGWSPGPPPGPSTGAPVNAAGDRRPARRTGDMSRGLPRVIPSEWRPCGALEGVVRRANPGGGPGIYTGASEVPAREVGLTTTAKEA